jgi:hypothetical protein
MADKNPNNCATCEHKQHPDGGWCYMFRHEPMEVCMEHTGMPRMSFTSDSIFRIMLAILPHQGSTQ